MRGRQAIKTMRQMTPAVLVNTKSLPKSVCEKDGMVGGGAGLRGLQPYRRAKYPARVVSGTHMDDRAGYFGDDTAVAS